MNSTYNINNLTPSEAAFAGGLLGTMMISICVIYIFVIIAFWKIFTKAGEKGWKSLIPFYNFYVALKIVGMSGMWLFALIAATILQTTVFYVALGDRANAYINGEIGLPQDVATNVWVILTIVLLIFVSLYVNIRFYYRLSKAFGKGVGYTIGLIFLPEIFTLILGFGSAKYDKKIRKA